MLWRPWPLLLEQDLTVPTPSWSYKWLCVGVLTCSQPTCVPGVGPCSLPPPPQDSHCSCLGFFQAFVNSPQSSFTNTKRSVPHLERRAQSMGGRCYCYMYTNEIVHQGLVVLCPSAWSRPTLCYLLLFLAKAGWTHPDWLLGRAHPKAHGFIPAPGKAQGQRLSRAQQDTAVWHPGGREVTGSGQGESHPFQLVWCPGAFDIGQAWLHHGLGEWGRGKPGLWKERISSSAHTVILDPAVL